MSFPPGPRLPPLLQAARVTASPHRWMVRRWERYGDVFSSRFPIFGRVVYVADPADVKRVFTGDPTVFHAGEANTLALGDALGEHSLLTLDEHRHMSQRKLLLPAFHGESVRRYVDVMAEATEREVATWPLGEEMALRPRMQAITLEVILRAVFGVRDGERRDDVLSLLLGARHEDGAPMTDTELRDQLLTLLTAGHETTATGLSWAFERLLRTPRVLERLNESLDDDEYVDAVVKEALRVRPGDRGRGAQAHPQDGDRRLDAAGRHARAAGDRGAPRPARPLRVPGGVPPGAVPRRGVPSPTPGSRSAAACGAASAPPSLRSR